MAKEFAKQFYNSKAWHNCRNSYINKRILVDGGLCEVCHSNIGYIVHHKVSLNPINIKDNNITLNHCNLQYVCKHCHDRMENHFIVQQKPFTLFDDNGNPVPNDDR